MLRAIIQKRTKISASQLLESRDAYLKSVVSCHNIVIVKNLYIPIDTVVDHFVSFD